MIFRDEEKQRRMRQTLDGNTLKQRIVALEPSTKYTYDTPRNPSKERIGITRIEPMSVYIPPVSTMKYNNKSLTTNHSKLCSHSHLYLYQSTS